MFRTLLISMFLTSAAFADTWTVDDDGKADFATVHEAMTAADDGDVILIAPGVYTETRIWNKRSILGFGGALTLAALDPTDKPILDGLGSNFGLRFSVGPGGSANLTNLVFRNCLGGVGFTGGAVWVEGSQWGHGEANVVGCEFENNHVLNWHGSAICGYRAHVNMQDCRFIGNTGGRTVWTEIGNSHGTVNATSCYFDSSDNGAVRMGGAGPHTFDSCVFVNNTVNNGGNGQAISWGSSHVYLYNTQVCGSGALPVWTGSNSDLYYYLHVDEYTNLDEECSDCNNNGEADLKEVMADSSLDCNSNLIIDECELDEVTDCNANGNLDSCDIADGTSIDTDGNGIPDECEGPVTWTVDDDGKADFDNIQAAVDASSDGDEIIVMPGTYTSTSDQVVDMVGKAVWLHSSDGLDVTIIDGENQRRGILCNSGETSKTIIDGFMVTNGYKANGGGGMHNDYSSSPRLTNCAFTNNTSAGNGGGIYNYGNSNPTIEGCTFMGNTAHKGGGMHNDYSTPTLDGCTFTNNSADDEGGGMWNYGSSPSLTNCIFENNTAMYGGGMYNEDYSSPTLINCTFTGNFTIGAGGGIWNWYSSPMLTDCTFESNIALKLDGGGMANWYSSPTLTGCTFTNNAAGGYYGGGIFNVESNPTLTNCAFENNTAVDDGGGMYNDGSSPILENCTFENNTADSGGGMINAWYSSPTLTDCTFTNNIATEWRDGGGGMYNWISSPTLNTCTFENNTAEYYGGGISNNHNSSPTLTGCTFESNTAEPGGGGMYNDDSSPTLTDCTFENNTACCGPGGGMWNYDDSNPTLTDTTVCGNSPDQIYGDWTDNGGNTIADVCPWDCPADVNQDGVVNITDILAMIGVWGSSDPLGDINADGTVNITDMLLLLSSWGPC